MTILKELWTGKSEFADVKISYRDVLGLRKRLEKMMKLAYEELTKKQARYNKNYDKKTKDRLLREGNKVSIMLSTNSNKLLIQGKENLKIRASAKRMRHQYLLSRPMMVKPYLSRLPKVEQTSYFGSGADENFRRSFPAAEKVTIAFKIDFNKDYWHYLKKMCSRPHLLHQTWLTNFSKCFAV